MKSLRSYLPESFLTELGEGPRDSQSPVSGAEAVDMPDPAMSVGGTRELSIGDPIIVGKGVQYAGAHGVIDSFGQGNRFVVVNLKKHGKHSFHSSDVEFDDYAEDREDEEEYHEDDDTDYEHARELDNLRRLSGY